MLHSVTTLLGFTIGSVVKNLPANAGDSGDVRSIPASERSHGEGNGNPFQYSCLENSMGRGAWQTTIHEVTKSRTQLNTHIQGPGCYCNTASGCIFAFFSVSMSLTSAYIIELHDPGEYFSNFLALPHTFLKY